MSPRLLRAGLAVAALTMMALSIILFVVVNAPHRSLAARQAMPRATVTLSGHTLSVELATTPAQWGRGLMGRARLAQGHGMLFVFPVEAQQSFWMKDTLIPLDILFFDNQGRLVSGWHGVQPCRHDPCRLYPSGVPARYVLELPAGSEAAMHLSKGASLGGLDALLPPPQGAPSGHR